MVLKEFIELNEKEDVITALNKSKKTVLRSREELKDRFEEVSVNYMNEIKGQGKTATMSSFKQSIRNPEFRRNLEKTEWIKKAMKRFGYKDPDNFWNDMLLAAKSVELRPYTTGIKK
jgi:hypothetical protein